MSQEILDGLARRLEENNSGLYRDIQSQMEKNNQGLYTDMYSKISENNEITGERMGKIESEMREINNRINFLKAGEGKVKIVTLGSTKDKKVMEVRRRAEFYLLGKIPKVQTMAIQENGLANMVAETVICADEETYKSIKDRYYYANGIYNLDFDQNPWECWDWYHLLNQYNQNILDEVFWPSKKRFLELVKKLRSKSLSKCYLFGTGPSLAKAEKRDWSDGYRIVCNTIVKDKTTWERINPDIIVAADAIYHFGHSSFARKFRSDLKKRLADSETFFVYPRMFHLRVMAEMGELEEKLIPIPIGEHDDILVDFGENFSLPHLGNILTLLMLPLGCYLSKDIYLWGFDGRAPKDKLFWANSDKHSYEEDKKKLVKDHPAFFNHHLPKDNPHKYVNEVHGETLENLLNQAEAKGWKFTMMHPSWTPTFRKRFFGGGDEE